MYSSKHVIFALDVGVVDITVATISLVDSIEVVVVVAVVASAVVVVVVTVPLVTNCDNRQHSTTGNNYSYY